MKKRKDHGDPPAQHGFIEDWGPVAESLLRLMTLVKGIADRVKRTERTEGKPLEIDRRSVDNYEKIVEHVEFTHDRIDTLREMISLQTDAMRALTEHIYALHGFMAAQNVINRCIQPTNFVVSSETMESVASLLDNHKEGRDSCLKTIEAFNERADKIVFPPTEIGDSDQKSQEDQGGQEDKTDQEDGRIS